MPPQSVEIAETISALKRALKRNSRPASSAPISQASNRGNKLKRGAQFVHQGSLAYIKGPEVYKEKIDHAGYIRYILQRNPPKYNDFGEEVDESEEEDDVDTWSPEENAYGGLKLEELLCPLKHPSELPVHPTLSQPYLSTAIPDMINTTNEQLQKEKANLSCAKDLHRQLIGDEAWVPCEVVESTEDWDLFDPKRPDPEDGAEHSHGKKRKRDEGAQEDAPSISATMDSSGVIQTVDAQEDEVPVNIPNMDTDMVDAEPSKVPASAERTTEKAPKTMAGTDEVASGKNAETDETANAERTTQAASSDGKAKENGAEIEDASEAGEKDTGTNDRADNDEAGSDAVSESPAQPTRRITRALAQTTNNGETNNPDAAATPPLSPTSSSSSHDIHPIYLTRPLQSQSQQHPYNLPPAEYSDTLSLLTSYIQKQVAFINTLNAVLVRLLQADRLRRTVFHWCKAEGHVGELSDGEDWIDEQAWGLERGEVKKGKGDEEDIEPVDGYLGRGKGKRRRGAG